jgi:hypothetical protein
VSTENREKEWAKLYGALSRALNLLGTENAFGEADYWIVDDDYGDTAHKLCIHKISFLRPQLIIAIQMALKPFPAWRVLLQMEVELDGAPMPPEGIVVYATRVEQHWDKARFASLAKMLNL